MTDPAQVTDSVSGGAWATLGAVIGTAISALAMLFTKRTEVSAQVEVAQVEAQASREADASARHVLETQIDAQADAAEHSLAVTVADRERAERLAIQGKHFDCLALVQAQNARITELSVTVATCEAKHANAEDRAAWYENRLAELEARLGIKARPAPKPRPTTPPNGTDVVTLAPVPTAPRRDPRRDP